MESRYVEIMEDDLRCIMSESVTRKGMEVHRLGADMVITLGCTTLEEKQSTLTRNRL